MWHIGVDDTGAARVTASRDLVGKISIKAQDFQGFLPRLGLINWLIMYKSKFSSFLYAVIFASVYDVSSSLYNTSYSDLTIMNLCYFSIYTSNFCK